MCSCAADSKVAADEITALECVGGGCRTPSIQEALRSLLPSGKALSFTLDGTSAIALGASVLIGSASGELKAACLVEAIPVGTFGVFEQQVLDPASDATLAADIAAEAELQRADAAVAATSAARNAYEAFIFETRGAMGTPDGKKLIPASIAQVLETAEEWLYDVDEATATEDLFTSKLASLRGEVEASAGEYYAKVAADRRAKEEELEREAALNAALAAANPEDPEDHDNRKLKFPDRMRIVLKNKEEGTELIKGGNHLQACQRYAKALLHCDKFVGDLTEEQKKEIAAVKLSLHLNCAQCFLKLEKPQKVISHCDDAVRLDPASSKAYYRRAVAKENTKDYDGAMVDVLKTLELTPDDPAPAALKTRLLAIKKREEERAKAVYGKMFSS